LSDFLGRVGFNHTRVGRFGLKRLVVAHAAYVGVAVVSGI
jgi:hypothetical protein